MYTLLLSPLLELGVSEWKSKKTFYIRKKYIDENGDPQFSKQGIKLSSEEWKVFKKNWESIKENLDNFFGLEAVDIVEIDPLSSAIDDFVEGIDEA